MTTSTQKIGQMLGTAKPGPTNAADAGVADAQALAAKQSVSKKSQPSLDMAEQLANCLNPSNQSKNMPR